MHLKSVCALTVAAALAPALAFHPQPAPEALTSYVDPFIGTGGHGHTFPGPSMPFGMIQPGPDTRLGGWDGSSGYHYSDTRLLGFSHTHLSGTGIPDYGDVLLMPATGSARFSKDAEGNPTYASAFRHDTEVAQPGYYAVTLESSGIRAELTSTVRAAIHRYTFPSGAPARVVLDLEHRDRLTDSSIDLSGDAEVTGFRRSTGWARDQVVYFVLRFSRPLTSRDTGPATTLRVFEFGSDAGELLVKVGISAVSVEGARKNLNTEISGWDFDAVRQSASAAWERELSKIRVTGGTKSLRTTFYTALYHAMLTPNVYSDVDGKYRGRDFKIHEADGFTYYTVFSLWDTFRALHPLLAIIDRARTLDFVKTMLRQYQEGGRLPVWELAANETDTMIGYHAVPVIADALVKGIDGFDHELAWRAITHSAELDRDGLAAYKRDGFISVAEAPESVSRTLEYAYDDWTIARAATLLGHGDEAARYLRRAQAYKHLFDPETGFMRARAGALWTSPFDPREVNTSYTEANAWQYSFFVPQDVSGLMRLLGGPAAFVRKLDALFAANTQTTGREQADITGLIGQYAHGNEPSHHVAYLYAYAGQPWKTQATVRRILDTLYHAAPDGLAGNDDCGQMSAWHVLSALGFYPVAPGSTEYVIGSPLFDSAAIHLENGRVFTIRRQATNSADAPYVQSARLNGAPHHRAALDHSSLASGGELSLDMGAAPNRSWGAAEHERPHSAIDDHLIVPAPFVVGGQPVFRGSQRVRLGDADPRVDIRCTLDGSVPAASSPRCDRPIVIDRDLTLRAIAIRAGEPAPSAVEGSSPVVATVFRHLPDYPRVTLSAAYAPQYAASGPDALVDGVRGTENFRLGGWQGFLGTDLDVTLDLGEPRDVREVTMGFLQDTGSWILMPRRIVLQRSADGVTFVDVGEARNTLSNQTAAATTREFTIAVDTRARYLRLHVERYGKLPAWHPGAGQEAWFFADEIVIR
jgi:predicted alpha-1,2-mannosidase